MRIVVALTGASGTVYGTRLVQALEEAGAEVHLVVSEGANVVAKLEGAKLPKAKHVYDEKNVAAAPASGSARFDAMVVCPCSMKTLAAISHGYADNLVTRAADVMIKERRRLVLVPRETPLSPIHLENMLKLSQLGVVILPPSPGFYAKPKTINDLVDFITGRVMDSLGIEHKLYKRWKGAPEKIH